MAHIAPTMAAPPKQSTVLDARAFDRTLRRMADEIVELNNGIEGLVIVGIQRRGVQLAAQIVSTIVEREKADVMYLKLQKLWNHAEGMIITAPKARLVETIESHNYER